MAKTKTNRQVINLEEIREACAMQVYRDWHCNAGVKRQRPINFEELARKLGTSRSLLMRSIRWHQAADPSTVRFAAGRPRKETGVLQEEVEWAVRPRTLRTQVGCSLKARVLMFNQRFVRDIKVSDLRGWYRHHKIRRQRFVAREGAPRLPSNELQVELLDSIRATMQRLYDEGCIICQLDEACFSPKKNDRRHWAPAREPIELPEKWTSLPQIKACGVICQEVGLVHCAYSADAFRGEDMAAIYKRVRDYFGPALKVAIFLDNATIHRAHLSLQAAQDVNIELVFNAPYRPDLNGIELLWRKAKDSYYKFCDAWRANGQRAWDQPELVRRCVEEVPVEMAKRCANKGWVALLHAEPIRKELRPWEIGALPGHAMMLHWLSGEDLATNYEEARAYQQVLLARARAGRAARAG